jgi:dipeptidyl aminopeptidase/acylaminoacyl peptidase
MNIRSLIAAAALLLAARLLAEPAASPAPEVRHLPLPGTGEMIACSVYPPKPVAGAAAGLVVHLHGSGGSYLDFNAKRPPFDLLRQRLAERGYWLVVPELGPNHWMNAAAVARLDAAIDHWIRQEGVDPARVHLLGSSMGASCSLIYVMRRPGKIKSVVAVFPPTDFPAFSDEHAGFRKGVMQAHHLAEPNLKESLRAFSPYHHLEDFRATPIFLLHGVKDPLVGVKHSRQFAEALRRQGSPVIYREDPEGVHKDDIVGPFQEEIADFLTRPATTPKPSSG